MEIAKCEHWPEQERAALLLVIHLLFSLHYAQQGLNRLVIREWIFTRSSHNVINRPLAYTPQDL